MKWTEGVDPCAECEGVGGHYPDCPILPALFGGFPWQFVPPMPEAKKPDDWPEQADLPGKEGKLKASGLHYRIVSADSDDNINIIIKSGVRPIGRTLKRTDLIAASKGAPK